MVLQDRFRVSQRRACRLTGQNRSTQRRPVPLADIEEQKLRSRMRELARSHVRWGRRLVYGRLRVEGWEVNHKRVQRIWREEGLQRPLPRKRKRARPSDGSRTLLRAEYQHHVWAIEFQFDQTMDGRRLKFLNILDEYSRVCLAIRVSRRCKAVDVIAAMLGDRAPLRSGRLPPAAGQLAISAKTLKRYADLHDFLIEEKHWRFGALSNSPLQ